MTLQIEQIKFCPACKADALDYHTLFTEEKEKLYLCCDNCGWWS